MDTIAFDEPNIQFPEKKTSSRQHTCVADELF